MFSVIEPNEVFGRSIPFQLTPRQVPNKLSRMDDCDVFEKDDIHPRIHQMVSRKDAYAPSVAL
ncbi:uncharacterized protein BYT42DRAFT_553604 [Radiomyces spectabilis]|uniref:uncharacterized protein n=1 Tax=Radiomyces spectabilis TaxID=64574 RepID=UPI00221FD5D0|nr:uncharacterized protein BYT42DRAFT_553604 [Radiomyces spectabilis]KAI8394171.1 hypothetical protein BYT42DRAFT_553604 [Radiomyces spectabilis]